MPGAGCWELRPCELVHFGIDSFPWCDSVIADEDVVEHKGDDDAHEPGDVRAAELRDERAGVERLSEERDLDADADCI